MLYFHSTSEEIQEISYYLCSKKLSIGGAYNSERIDIPEKVIKILHGRFVHMDKTNRFANFGLLLTPKCIWRPGSA